jgi:GT2 family glycosyltransferase
MVRAEFPAVHLVASKDNLGFAAGNNRALRELQIADRDSPASLRNPSYVWLLNPDTEVQPGATAALMAALESLPQAGVVGAKLAYSDGSLQQSAFRFPGLLQLLFEFLPLPPRLYETPFNGRYPRHLYEGSDPFPVDHPLGAAMMVRPQAIADVGLMDEGFWMYCEEIDWCWRMRRAGWRSYCVPTARVVHHAGQSSGQVRISSFVALWRSRLLLFDKHYPVWKRLLARALVGLGMRFKAYQARAAYRQDDIGSSELQARIEAYRLVAREAWGGRRAA